MSARILSVLFFAAALAGAAYWPVRLAWADVYARRGELERAIRLCPGEAHYWARAGRFDDALRLNPRLASAWIGLGLAAERRGELAPAERALLAAAGVDRTFVPAWTLANFYARRERREELWTWARQSAAIALNSWDRDPDAVFRLCWRAAPDPDAILRRAVPDSPPAWRRYLGFLLAEGRLEAARDIAMRLLPRAAAADVPVLLDYCDRELAWGRSPHAVWNSLAGRRLIPFPPLAPGRGPRVTNGDFAVPLTNRGFDWRFLSPAGVRARNGERGLTLVLSGKQPETCELMFQYVPAPAGGRYRVESSPSLPEGISWNLAAAGPDLLRLALVYRRPPGSMRLEGAVRLARVEVRLE